MATHDEKGAIHTSAKGLLKLDAEGKIFLLDLYKGRTCRNIKKNPNVTLTFIDDRKFAGYAIMGKARIRRENAVPESTLKEWEKHISKRMARRIVSHVKQPQGVSDWIPEASFPAPKHVIEVKTERVVDLAPQRGAKKK